MTSTFNHSKVKIINFAAGLRVRLFSAVHMKISGMTKNKTVYTLWHVQLTAEADER